MFKNVKPLQREVKEKFTPKKMMTFDIETGSVVGDALFGPFALGCLYDGKEYTFYDSMEEFLKIALQYAGFTFFAHNAKGYELNYLLDPLRALIANDDTFSLETVQQGQQVIEFVLTRKTVKIISQRKNKGQEKVQTKTWKFADTLPLFACSLEELTKAYCPDVAKLVGEIDFQTEVFDRNNQRHIEYLKRDCESLFVAYRRLETMIFDQFHCGLGLTAGSTAMKAFVATIPEGVMYYRHNKSAEEYSREALRGGIVLPGLTTKVVHNVSMYDVKAAYGYHMLTKDFPMGNAIHTFRYQEGKQGVYKCTVHAPATLPVGCIAERGTSVYPLGTFKATCTSVDIDFAKEQGYTFEIEDGYYWEDMQGVFHDFAVKCQELEITSVVDETGKKTHPFKPLAKLLRNSLYGKFGSKPVANKMMISKGEIPEGAQLVIDPDTGNIVDGLYTVQEMVDENYMIPAWAAFITASQRAYLMSRVYAAYEEGATSVYCDTDSMTCETEVCEKLKAKGLLSSDGKYGSWEFEKSGHLLALAPKVYAIADDTGETVKVRAKGLPIHSKATLAFTNPELKEMLTFVKATCGDRDSYTWRTSNSVRTRMMHPEKEIVNYRSRMISDLSNSKSWTYDPLMQVISPIIRTLEEATAGTD